MVQVVAQFSVEQMYELSSGEKKLIDQRISLQRTFHMNTDLHAFYSLEVSNNLCDLGFEDKWGCLSPASVFCYVCGIWEMLMTCLCKNLPL